MINKILLWERTYEEKDDKDENRKASGSRKKSKEQARRQKQ